MELAFFPSPSPMEIMVIAVIALIVLGPSRLPEAARSLGKGLKEMRASFQGSDDEHEGYERLDDDVRDDDLVDADPEPLDEDLDDAELEALDDDSESLDDEHEDEQPAEQSPAVRGQ